MQVFSELPDINIEVAIMKSIHLCQVSPPSLISHLKQLDPSIGSVTPSDDSKRVYIYCKFSFHFNQVLQELEWFRHLILSKCDNFQLF